MSELPKNPDECQDNYKSPFIAFFVLCLLITLMCISYVAWTWNYTNTAPRLGSYLPNKMYQFSDPNL